MRLDRLPREHPPVPLRDGRAAQPEVGLAARRVHAAEVDRLALHHGGQHLLVAEQHAVAGRDRRPRLRVGDHVERRLGHRQGDAAPGGVGRGVEQRPLVRADRRGRPRGDRVPVLDGDRAPLRTGREHDRGVLHRVEKALPAGIDAEQLGAAQRVDDVRAGRARVRHLQVEGPAADAHRFSCRARRDPQFRREPHDRTGPQRRQLQRLRGRRIGQRRAGRRQAEHGQGDGDAPHHAQS